MRGIYNITDVDRVKFFHALLKLCEEDFDGVDLISTQLSLSNCLDLLRELGYEPELNQTAGWEGETWWTCYHTSAPAISFNGSVFYGDLDMYWSDRDDDIEINVEAFKEVMREKWGRYFPVI